MPTPSPSGRGAGDEEADDVAMDMGDSNQRHTRRRAQAQAFTLLTPVRVRGSRSHATPSSGDRTSPLPPTTPMTPNRIRAQDERLLHRGQTIAAEYSQRRRRPYEFQTLPDSGQRTPSHSPPYGGSPARYSLDQVTNAVGSFADFLYLLEDRQMEHPLMPTIMARYAELGAVIESQKRHIDHWKAKELDLAISEAQEQMDAVGGINRQLETKTLECATAVLEKQMWEEKYDKAVLETKSIAHRAQDQIAHLTAKINELQLQKQDLESTVNDRNGTIANMERDFGEQLKILEQMERQGDKGVYENRSLVEQCTRQEQTLRGLQSQMQQLQQQCEAERKRAEELNSAAHVWEIKHHEEKRLREHMETELMQARQEREENVLQMKKLMGESGKFRADVEALAAKYEHQVQLLRETLKTKDVEMADLMQKLQNESDRGRQLSQDTKTIRQQAEEGFLAIKNDLEQSFVARVARLREELGEETQRVRGENEELMQRCQHLQQLNQKKSTQIAELMSTQQSWVGEGNQRLNDLTSAVGEWQSKCEELQHEIREREKASAEALRKQGGEIQEQFSTHVRDMETYLERKTAESNQLRGTVKAREDELLKLRDEAHTEISRWQKECQEISTRSNAIEFECGALQREVEHRKKELELRENEVATLKQQIEAYLSPDNERSKQTELLQRERLRLEDQNRNQQQQMEALKREFNAKLDEINSSHRRAAEQESAQRATIVSLHHEKDDLQRALSEISAEKVALEGHLQGMLEEKEVMLESLTQFEKQNGELEDKGRELLEALTDVEREKDEVLHALETTQKEKKALENNIVEMKKQFHQQMERHARAVEQLDTQGQVEQLSAQLQRCEAEMHDLQRQAKTYHDAARVAEEGLVQAKQVLQQRESELRQQAQQLAEQQGSRGQAEQLFSRVRQREGEIAELQRQVTMYRDAAGSAEEKLAQATEALKQRESEVSHTRLVEEQSVQSEVDRLAAQLQRRDADNIELQRQARKYQDNSQAAEEKSAKLTQTLRQRDTELSQAKRLVETSKEQYREAETKYQSLGNELTHMREWNERYKKELEAMKVQAEERERQRKGEAEAREGELMRQGRGLEAEYEKLKAELTTLQNTAGQEVRRLQMELETQKSKFQLEHQRLVATIERLDRQARGSTMELTSLNGELTRLREEVAQAKADADFHGSVLKQREEQLQHVTRGKTQAEESLEQCQGQVQRVERAFDDFKRQTMRNVKEKKDAIDRLEDESNDLRSKLAQQTELKEQAMQFAQGDKNAMTTELLRKEQHLSEARARLRVLEEQVKSLQRELKSRNDGVKTNTEGEQRKRIAAELEKAELQAQVVAMREEKEMLRAKLSSATDEVACLRRDLNSNADEMEHARSDLKHTKTELATRLSSIERELHHTQTTLVTERDRNKKLKDQLKEARKGTQTDVIEKSQEIESLTAKVRQVVAEMERKDQLHAERVDDLQSNESNLIKRLKLVQQRCDACSLRETELQKELSDLVSRTSEERQQLMDELKQTQIVNEMLQGGDLLQEGVSEMKNQLVEERKLVRHHAITIERKESLIRDLEARVRKLEARVRQQEATFAASKHDVELNAQDELEGMNAKLSKLTIENERLREDGNRDKVSLVENTKAIKSQLKAKCVKLQQQVEQLEEDNDDLRAQQQQQQDLLASAAAASKQPKKQQVANHEKCDRQIERLVAALEEKEADLVSLRELPAEHKVERSRRREQTPSSSVSSSSSPRVRELERSLDEKEHKILMLNDHLTYLMTSTIELQHENETILALQHQEPRSGERAP